ncbi:5248_t:CDS:1, partial [Acaulospora morrowiae]
SYSFTKIVHRFVEDASSLETFHVLVLNQRLTVTHGGHETIE